MTVIHGRNITAAIATQANKILRSVSKTIGTDLKAMQDTNNKLAIGKYDFAVNAGTFTFLDAAVVVTADTITKAAHGLVTGDAVILTTTGTLPTGLSASTAYYAIYVNSSTFKLATTRANAFAGTAIDITAAAGGGTHTLMKNVFGDINLLPQGMVLPDKAIITRTFFKVYTTFASVTTDNATIAVTAESAADITAAVAIKTAGDKYDAAAPVAGAQDNAIGNFLTLTANRELLMNVAVDTLTAGKIKVFVEYVDAA